MNDNNDDNIIYHLPASQSTSQYEYNVDHIINKDHGVIIIVINRITEYKQ